MGQQSKMQMADAHYSQQYNYNDKKICTLAITKTSARVMATRLLDSSWDSQATKWIATSFKTWFDNFSSVFINEDPNTVPTFTVDNDDGFPFCQRLW